MISRPKRFKLKAPRGQAMVEYSIITHFILFMGVMGLLPLMVYLFQALNIFFDGIYFVLQSSTV